METKPSLAQTALRYGLILGFSQVAITLLAYLIDKMLLVSFWTAGISFVVSITIIVLGVKQYKKMDNFISFKDAFLICLISMIGATLINSIFLYVLHNLIDPNLSAFMKEQTIQKTISFMEKMGTPEDAINQAIASMEEQDFSQTPAKIGTQFLWGAIFSAIPALIIAAIMRTKQKPVDDIQ